MLLTETAREILELHKTHICEECKKSLDEKISESHFVSYSVDHQMIYFNDTFHQYQYYFYEILLKYGHIECIYQEILHGQNVVLNTKSHVYEDIFYQLIQHHYFDACSKLKIIPRNVYNLILQLDDSIALNYLLTNDSQVKFLINNLSWKVQVLQKIIQYQDYFKYNSKCLSLLIKTNFIDDKVLIELIRSFNIINGLITFNSYCYNFGTFDASKIENTLMFIYQHRKYLKISTDILSNLKSILQNRIYQLHRNIFLFSIFVLHKRYFIRFASKYYSPNSRGYNKLLSRIHEYPIQIFK
jgi:hypothetical protein